MVSVEFITFACTDPDRLAEFWAGALDGERRGLPEEFDDVIVDTPDDGPDLLFREGGRGTDRDLPIHLDLETDRSTRTVERLRDLGAIVRETKTREYDTFTATWTVMEDPAGNGFCVTEH